MLMSDAVSSEGPETTGHPTKVFGLYPYCTEISPGSLNLLMMLCIVDDEICKALTLRNVVFFKYSTIFLRTLSQIESLCPSLFLRDCLSKTSLL